MMLSSRDHLNADVNFNSPGHRSSQDGSFLEDDADMHLILDFDLPTAEFKDRKDNKTVFRPTSVLSSSWISRKQSTWATDFDTNIAELDFDNVATRDILSLGGTVSPEWRQKDKDWNENHLFKGISESLKISLSCSQGLFTSNVETPEEVLERVAGMGNGFISTDSLDLSSLDVDSEQLRAVCLTKKAEYVLTFESGRTADSEMAMSSMLDYQDAQLSHVSEEPTNHLKEDAQASNTHFVSSGGFTTWGKIRRSYEVSSPVYSGQPSMKSTSLPNINRSPSHGISGAGESMLSGGKLPLYSLSDSASVESHFQSRMSLLQVFQNKLNLEPATAEAEDNILEASFDGQHPLKSSGDANDETKEEEEVTLPLPTTPHMPEQSVHAFDDNQRPEYRPMLSQIQDYNYAEFYINGRYIDINHNEIGFIPPSTQGVQQAITVSNAVAGPSRIFQNNRASLELSDDDEERSPRVNDRWATLAQPKLTKIAPIKPPRTFAALLETSGSEEFQDTPKTTASYSAIPSSRLKESSTQVPVYVMDQSAQTSCWDSGKLVTTVVTATTVSVADTGFSKSASLCNTTPPDLNFMKLPFTLPPFLPSAPPFPLAALNDSYFGFTGQTTPLSASRLLGKEESVLNPLSTNPFQTDFGLTKSSSIFGLHADGADLPNPPSMYASTKKESQAAWMPRDRDSGLGSSGPSHIQDWESLAALLPKDVAQTCSFLKANTQLLARSQTGSNTTNSTGCSIDKPDKKLYGVARVKRTPALWGGGLRRQRPVSEPMFERKCKLAKFESIIEEDNEQSPIHKRKFYYRNRSEMGCCVMKCQCRAFNSHPGGALVCCVPQSCCHAVWCHPPEFSHHPPTPVYETPRCSCCAVQTLPAWNNDTNLKRWHRYRVKSENQCLNCGLNVNSYNDSEISDMENSWDADVLQKEDGVLRTSMSSSEDEVLADQYNVSCSPSHYHCKWSSDNKNRPKRLARSLERYGGHLDSSFLSVHKEVHGRYGCHMSTHSDMSQMKRACATCFRIRSPSLDMPPAWAIDRRNDCLCDCQTSDVLEERKRLSSYCEEYAVQSTPVYYEKKKLVEDVMDACEVLNASFANLNSSTPQQVEISRWQAAVSGLIRNSLCPTMVKLISDGLMPDSSVWTVIQESANRGPATKSIHELVIKLNTKGLEPREHSLQIFAFISGLLKLNCLDCWLSYLVLKDALLRKHYAEAAFLRQAAGAFRSLFARLIASVQSLGLLPFGAAPFTSASSPERKKRSTSMPAVTRRETFHKELCVTFETPENEVFEYCLLPTRLPSDSRVPKSSSTPSRLSEVDDATEEESKTRSVDSRVKKAAPYGHSRIPVLKNSPVAAKPASLRPSP